MVRRQSALVLSFAIVAVGVSGCQPTSPVTDPDGETSPSAEKPVGKTPPVPPKEIKIEPSSKLNHDGFRYAGVGYGKPLTYTFARGSAPGEDGTQEVRLVKQTDDLIEIKRVRSGGLSSLGEDTIRVTEKGVFVISQTMGTMDKPAMELPAVLKPGVTWSETVKFDQQGTLITQVGAYRVLPETTLIIEGETLNAMPVKLTGTMTMSGKKITMTATAWYVRDLGMVKMEMATEDKEQGKQTASILLKEK